MENKISICIAGKNNIAVEVTKYIIENYPDINIFACFNSTDNGMNFFQRSFKNFCSQHGIPEITIDKLYSIENLIFLSLEFDKIIKPNLFKSQSLYNIHFSFLPEYKGMYTSALPIINGELYSGVTLHKIDAGIDTGEIIDQLKFHLYQGITAECLYFKYIKYGTYLVIKNINDILEFKVKSISQSPIKSSYYSKKTIDYNNLKIDINKTAFEIMNQIHGYVFPAYQLPEFNNYKIYKASITYEKSNLKPGSLMNDEDFFLTIATIDYNLKLFKDRREELFQSAIDGDLKVLNYFIKNQYDIFQKNEKGWDVAIISAYNGSFEYLEFVIEKLNWNINVINYNGTTLLMYVLTNAFISNDANFLNYFLEKYQPNVYLKDYYGHDVFYYAKKYSNKKIFEIIKNYKEKND